MSRNVCLPNKPRRSASFTGRRSLRRPFWGCVTLLHRESGVNSDTPTGFRSLFIHLADSDPFSGAMNSLGAGGAQSPWLVNGANALTFGLMVVTATLTPVLIRFLGVKWSLFFGAAGYAPYAAALYCNIVRSALLSSCLQRSDPRSELWPVFRHEMVRPGWSCAVWYFRWSFLGCKSESAQSRSNNLASSMRFAGRSRGSIVLSRTQKPGSSPRLVDDVQGRRTRFGRSHQVSRSPS